MPTETISQITAYLHKLPADKLQAAYEYISALAQESHATVLRETATVPYTARRASGARLQPPWQQPGTQTRETVQVQLPPILVERVRQEISSHDDALNQAMIEAIQIWLLERQQESVRKDSDLQNLRQAGIVMPSNRQRAFAEGVMSTLSVKKAPTYAQVEASLSNLQVPLSAEIIAMRWRQSEIANPKSEIQNEVRSFR